VHDLVPDDVAPSTGLAAALLERQGAAAAAEAADAARGAEGGGDPAGAPGAEAAAATSVEHRVMVEMALAYLDGWMAGWHPGFQPPAGALRESGINAACVVLAKYGMGNAPPELMLVGFLVIGYGPPFLAGWKTRRAAKLGLAEADSSS
jgi:hypothetical protein